MNEVANQIGEENWHPSVYAQLHRVAERTLRRESQKRGGDKGRGIPLHVSIADNANYLDVLEPNDELETLGSQWPRAALVGELTFFGGLTSEETSVETSEQIRGLLRTVKSDWRFAKAWLYRELGSEQDDLEA